MTGVGRMDADRDRVLDGRFLPGVRAGVGRDAGVLVRSGGTRFGAGGGVGGRRE